MASTKISWATDVWNPVTGCTRVSPGCLNCYADRLHNFRYRANYRAAVDWWNRSPQGQEAGSLKSWRPILANAFALDLDGLTLPQALRLAQVALFTLPWPPTYDTPFATVQVHPDRLVVPIRAKKPRTYFVNSMSDLFHQDIPPDFLDAVFTKIELADWHKFIVLTKRPEAAQAFMKARYQYRRTAPWNLAIVFSVENQETLDARTKVLLETPAQVRGLSIEPLLERVDLARPFFQDSRGRINYTEDDQQRPMPPGLMTGLDWIIIGGESGPNFRPMDIGWAAQVASQAIAGGVPAVFMKQPSGFRNEAPWPALYVDQSGNLTPLPILRDPPPWPRRLE